MKLPEIIEEQTVFATPDDGGDWFSVQFRVDDLVYQFSATPDDLNTPNDWTISFEMFKNEPDLEDPVPITHDRVDINRSAVPIFIAVRRCVDQLIQGHPEITTLSFTNHGNDQRRELTYKKIVERGLPGWTGEYVSQTGTFCLRKNKQ